MTLGNVDLRSRGASRLETRCAARAGQPPKREAQKELTRIFQQVEEQWTSNSTVFLGHALNEWLRTAELHLVAIKVNFRRIVRWETSRRNLRGL
jgi:hypothetical protein